MKSHIPYFQFFRRFLLAALCSAGTYSSVSGQVFPVAESTPTTPLPTDAWKFMRYGGFMPDLYTGAVDVQIPLYTFKDIDFEVPLSLTYASEGFRPNDPHGILGLGWSLSVGGMITREIVGVPDDFYDEPASYSVSNDDVRYGFYYYNRVHPYEWIFNRFDMNRKNEGVADFDAFMFKRPIGTNLAYETAPDVFSFKFGDHSGKFILGNREEVHFMATNHPSGEYKIKFRFYEAINDKKKKRLAEIIITTGDGYKYYFGDDRVRLYGTYQFGNPQVPEYEVGELLEYTTSWPLLRIEAPSGREIYFYYDVPPQGTYYETFQPTVSNYGPQLIDSSNPYTCEYQVDRYVHSRKAICQYRLDMITASGKKIVQFTYADKTYKQYRKDGNSDRYGSQTPVIDNRGLLSEIEIQYDKTIKKYNFDYWYNPNSSRALEGVGNPIPFLRTMRSTDGETYGFEYYREAWNAPYFGTTAIDYAGFYNSSTGNDSSTEYGLNNIRQQVNPEGALFGMLKKITYPTGGFTTYEYEPNDYSRIMVRDTEMSAPRLIATGGNDIQGAGLRVKSITDCVMRPVGTGTIDDFENSDLVIDTVSRREYIYEKNGSSTGNCLSYAKQIYAHLVQPYASQSPAPSGIPATTVAADLKAKSLQIPQSVDRTGLEYRSVIEKRMDGSSKEYRFCAYDDLPDKMLSTDTLSHTGNIQIRGARFLEVPSLCSQRGKLLEVKSFAPDGTLVEREQYEYGRQELETIPFMTPLVDKYYINHHYIEDYPLKSVVTCNYMGADSVKTTKSYSYNALNQPSMVETYNHSRWRYRQTIRYLHERTDLPDSLGKEVKRLNLLNLVSEQTEAISKGHEPDGGRKKVAYEYESRTGRYVRLKAIHATNYLESSSESNPDAALDCQITYDKYSPDNRVMQTTDRNGVPTCYIWDRDERFLLAKVTNVFYDKLPTIHPYIGRLSEEDKTKLRAIRGALVETFDYDPAYGLTRHTDPRGIETVYEYYDNGKLKAIKDAQGNPITEYDYSFR